MDEDVKEMIWECENNSKYKAHFKDPAQESFCTYNSQTNPMHPRRFDKSVVKTLHKPFNTEVSVAEKNMASAINTKLTQPANFSKAKQNGNGYPSIFPAHFMFLQKPAKNADVESRKIHRTFHAAVAKQNHTIGSAFEKSFPIKNAASLSLWSGACRQSPKKMQRRQITTVEETVRTEEKEIYRQLIQVVTGKTFLSTNSTTFIPPQVSRRLSSSSVSGPPGASSLSSLEPCTLDVEPTYQPQFSLVSEKHTTVPVSVDTTFRLTCENRDVSKHQLRREQNRTTQEQSKGSDSVIVLDSVSKEDHPSRPIFQAELWIKELTSLYDSRARERRRRIEEQKALALKLQNQRLQERSVPDVVNLNLRVPLEKEIPVTLLPRKEESVQEEPEFPELTPEMEREIKHALYGGSQDQVLSEAFRLTISRKDIMTLNSLNWLNDEIINFYMNLLMERSKRKGFPKVHAFNTFFFPKLKSAGFQAVKRWTKKVDVFDVNILLVPVHLGVHWCLAVMDFRNKIITYYDSMGGHNNEACRILLQYLKQESQDKKGICFDTNGWNLSSKKSHEIPQQMNGSDCGMFACKYADYITKDKRITFTQHHMPYFRKRMVWEIVHQKLL